MGSTVTINYAAYSFYSGYFLSEGYAYNGARVSVKPDDPENEYWEDHTDYIPRGTLTWQKPDDVANSEARRDFTITFTAYTDSNCNNVLDEDETTFNSVTLNVHIGYAEVQVQFAGEGDYRNTVSAGGQNAGNTVIAGQKVSAVINADPRVTINSYQWVALDDRIKNYVTTNNNGQVVNLTPLDCAASNFKYYHIDTLNQVPVLPVQSVISRFLILLWAAQR